MSPETVASRGNGVLFSHLKANGWKWKTGVGEQCRGASRTLANDFWGTPEDRLNQGLLHCVSMDVSAATISFTTPGAGLAMRETVPTLDGAVADNRANVEDRQLVDRCLSGDAAAWEEIVRQSSRRIYNLCFRFTGRAEDAEDLAQEAFLRVYRNLGSYRSDQGSLLTWISSLTRNLLIDHYRRSRNARMTDSIDDEENAPGRDLRSRERSPDQAVWNREVHDHVQQALTRLSPELREAVILRDLQDMDYKEIALALHLPEGTVKSRINRGRIELARLLKRRLGGPGRE